MDNRVKHSACYDRDLISIVCAGGERKPLIDSLSHQASNTIWKWENVVFGRG